MGARLIIGDVGGGLLELKVCVCDVFPECFFAEAFDVMIVPASEKAAENVSLCSENPFLQVGRK